MKKKWPTLGFPLHIIACKLAIPLSPFRRHVDHKLGSFSSTHLYNGGIGG